MTAAARALAHLAAIRTRYPDVWLELERFRAMRRRGLSDWPAWCYCPLAGAYAIVSGGGSNRVPPDRVFDVAIVGALGAWRMTQGIYVFDTEVSEQLRSTPLDGEIPDDVLLRLPEWCVYVQTEGLALKHLLPDDPAIHGYYAHLECDTHSREAELRLLFDCDGGLVPLALHLGGRNLADALAESLAYSARHVDSADAAERIREVAETIRSAPPEHPSRHTLRELSGLVSLVLYLCTADADVVQRETGALHPRRPPRRYPKAPTTWDVAHRLGAALRALPSADTPGLGGTHASPRPHIRRAHWHAYWLGEHDSPERHAELRWLPPIPVNAELGPLVPVIHRVQ